MILLLNSRQNNVAYWVWYEQRCNVDKLAISVYICRRWLDGQFFVDYAEKSLIKRTIQIGNASVFSFWIPVAEQPMKTADTDSDSVI